MEVYGKEVNVEQQVQSKKSESKTNHQRKIEDHYMNDIIGEQKQTECDDQNHQKYKDYMELNNENRHVNPSDQKEYHHQKKYHDLYSTYVISGQEKQNQTDDLKKTKSVWEDKDHDNQRK